MRKKGSEIYLEYRGGYALVSEGDLVSVIRGYRDGVLRKDGLRLFAARLEKSALHEKSRVDLSRIVNCKAKEKGIKRLRAGVMREGEIALNAVLKSAGESPERLKAVSRKALRAIAQGRMNCTEAVVLLMYSLRRISQRKPLRRLLENERYARFTYRQLSELSGIPKANISRAVASLKRSGFLGTVWVVKQNENQFGLLFVDGPLTTLIPGAALDRSQRKANVTTTPGAQFSNTAVIELPTLKNSYPKTVKEKSKDCEMKGGEGCFSSDWHRILERARAMKENEMEQVA